MSFTTTPPPSFVTNPKNSAQIAADTGKQVLKDKQSTSTSAQAGGDLNAGYFAYLNNEPTQHIGADSFNKFYDSLTAGNSGLSQSDRAALQAAAVQVAGEDGIAANDASHWVFNGGQGG